MDGQVGNDLEEYEGGELLSEYILWKKITIKKLGKITCNICLNIFLIYHIKSSI